MKILLEMVLLLIPQDHLSFLFRVLGSNWALQKAKYNIEHYYAVVGVLEQFNKTLAVFEEYVPAFFSGAAKLYDDKGRQLIQVEKCYYLTDFIKLVVRMEIRKSRLAYLLSRRGI